VADSFEQGNEFSGSVTDDEILTDGATVTGIFYSRMLVHTVS
jgi:hypothetical protein